MKSFSSSLILIFLCSALYAQQVDEPNPTPAPIYCESTSNRCSFGDNDIKDKTQFHFKIKNYATGNPVSPNHGLLISSDWCRTGALQGHQSTIENFDPAYFFRILGKHQPNGSSVCNTDDIILNIDTYGRVGIGNNIEYARGTDGVDYKLFVQKGIRTERVKVDGYSSDWADYVFAKDYKLMSFSELDAYIQANKHLPNIPSAEEVEREGIDLAKMDGLLLAKIEELTLYMLQLQKQNQELQKQIDELKKAQK